MSIIFGIRVAPNELVSDFALEELSRRTDHMAPDGTYIRVERNVGLGFQPFYTHLRSRLETRPVVDENGNALLWDGRLDNFADLADLLDLPGNAIPDSQIVIAAWRCWGEDCFSRLIGEWALALVSHFGDSLYLVRDHAGTRTLYYQLAGERVLWSSALDTLVSLSSRRDISDEFVGRYLSSVPAGTLTPYRTIRAVPPGHFIKISERSAEAKAYWRATWASPLTYKTDAEYEEQFVDLFRQAVERRARSGESVLAELSGGMDSSAIVCMSDESRRNSAESSAGFIDTISYFDSSEPNWNEKPFVSAVESRRGKSGIHIDLSLTAAAHSPDFETNGQPSLWPEDCQLTLVDVASGHRSRVVLSGLGGDELLGGIPTPLPELADLLYRHDYVRLLSRSFSWCVTDRKALVLRLREVARFRSSVYEDSIVEPSDIPKWASVRLATAFDPTNDEALDYSCWRDLPPSIVSFRRAWRILLETLPTHAKSDRKRTEYRFPYLDRDLVDFLARVPREQLVRPGRRRSLMRRALGRFMPVEVVERRRKAFVIRRPVRTIRDHYAQIRRLFEQSVAAERGYIDRSLILRALEEFQTGTSIGLHRSLTRAINLERWLRTLEDSA
jgi:asparagine synthase (glutamine-hydrolysing)